MPRSQRQPTNENPFSSLPPKCVFKSSSLHVIKEGKEKKKDTQISLWDRTADKKLLTSFLVGWMMHSHQLSHILSHGVARTVRFVIRCGSYIHTWRVLPRHHLLFTALWYFKAGGPSKMVSFCFLSPSSVGVHARAGKEIKEVLLRRWRQGRRRMRIQSCLSTQCDCFLMHSTWPPLLLPVILLFLPLYFFSFLPPI